jgi:hypothetical protein
MKHELGRDTKGHKGTVSLLVPDSLAGHKGTHLYRGVPYVPLFYRR